MPEWKEELRQRLGALELEPLREAEILEELSQHLEDRSRELMLGGASPDEAYRAAFEELTASEKLTSELRRVERARRKEQIVLGAGRQSMIKDLWQDLHYGLRGLRKHPGVSLAAIITLALGIGANTSIFSVANTVLLRPLPYPQPDELMMVWETAVKLGFPHNDVAPANFIDWRDQNKVFSNIAAYSTANASLTGHGEPERIEGARGTAGLFRLLGVAPSLGRFFSSEEEKAETSDVVVISHSLWQRSFGGDVNIIGRSLLLNNRAMTVIGVMPASFQFPSREQEYWLPMVFPAEEAAGRGDHYLNVVARLRPGVTRLQAQAEMDGIAARLQQQYPRTNTDQGVALVPLHEELAGNVRKPLFILLGVVGFVLLIGCANVINLLLARTIARRKELTIRVALGASRSRVIRQLLTESVLLAVLGGVVGTLLAIRGVSFLETLIPDSLSSARGIVIDSRVLGFSIAVSLVTGIACGLFPALQVYGLNLIGTLKSGSQTGKTGTGHTRLRGALVIGELALSLMLLAGAGLLIKSYYRLANVEPGFQPQGSLTLRMQFGGPQYGDPVKRRAFYDQLVQQISSIPGAQAAGVITQLPLTTQGLHFSFSLEGQPPLPSANLPQAAFRVISSDYFRAMGIPLLRGRTFTPQDNSETQAVAVINRTMAERYWPGQEALGKRFKVGSSDSPNPWHEVIGVVGDVRQSSLDQALKPEMYVTHLQDRRFFAVPRDLVVRTTGDPLAFLPAVRAEIRKLDKDLPLFRVQTMEQVVAGAVAGQRFNMLLLAVFAALALIMAVIGIYGVMAYTTAQSTHEFGIRIALGAGAGDVLKLVMRRGLVLTLCGIGIGLVGALTLTRMMSGLLFNVSATDPLTFGLIVLLLTVVSLLACYIPARRATRIDPLVALRYE